MRGPDVSNAGTWRIRTEVREKGTAATFSVPALASYALGSSMASVVAVVPVRCLARRRASYSSSSSS
jgi:hypothetical protein